VNTITTCPCELVSRDTWELLRAVRLFEKGLPPVVGGVLDQSAWFVAAADFVMTEEAACRRVLKI